MKYRLAYRNTRNSACRQHTQTQSCLNAVIVVEQKTIVMRDAVPVVLVDGSQK